MFWLAGCHGGGGGGKPDPPPENASPLAPQITSVSVPETLAPQRTAQWTVTWKDGTPPYTIQLDLGGGATPNVPAGTAAASPFAAEFTMLNNSLTQSAAYSYVITVTDSESRSDQEVGEYVVLPSMAEQAEVVVPAGMQGSAEATWAVNWDGGSQPYTIAVDLGGGARGQVPEGTQAEPPFSKSFKMINPSKTTAATYSYDVSVTDALGFVARASGLYEVGPLLNLPPVISNAGYIEIERTLHVSAADPDGDLPLTITITQPPGLNVDATSRTASAGGTLSADFEFAAKDVFTGADGITRVTVTDRRGGVSEVLPVLVRIPPYLLEFDTLYAIPMQSHVHLGEPVTVVVTSGVPAGPFRFVNGVGLTVDSSGQIVPLSFNVGKPGGEPAALDGIWAWFAQDAQMLLPPDEMILHTDIGEGRERWDLSLTPIGGTDLSYAYGALFNVQFTFSTPGTKFFGFQEFSVVKRTYYSNGANSEYFWSDISNDRPGVPNSVVVE